MSPTSSRSSQDKDDGTPPPTHPPTVSFQDAHQIVANGQKTLQDWNKRWGTAANISFEVIDTFLKSGHAKMPNNCSCSDLLAVVRKGREALLQLNLIASMDLRSVEVGSFPSFWMDSIRVVEEINERVSLASLILQVCSQIQSRM
jgi:hypothetical protein